MLAQTRGQRRGAAPNPFEIAGMVKSYQDMMRPSGGYSLSRDDEEDDIKPRWWKGYGFKNKPTISKSDMEQMWNMSTGYGNK